MNNVLVVIDMQNDFISGVLGTEEAQGIVSCVVEKIKGFDGPVYFTRDTHLEDYLSTQEGKNLPVQHCRLGTWGWELSEEIKPLAEGKPAFDKGTFGSKELAIYLAQLPTEEQPEEIHLVGLCTDICVLANALTIKTFLPETELVVDADCCAGVTPQRHETALKAMAACQIRIDHPPAALAEA